MEAPKSNATNTTELTGENTPVLEGEALKEAIVKQVEYYLSRQNLANDSYLVSHMNSELFVPLAVILHMNKMKQLTSDVQLIVTALKSSSQITVDEKTQMIKPNFKLSRNTLILRDIPGDVPTEEVQGIFNNSNCGKVVSIRPEVGDCWFVQMEDEEQAQKTCIYIVQQQFRGKKIQARIKSENLLRSIPSGGYHQQGQGAGPEAVQGYSGYSNAGFNRGGYQSNRGFYNNNSGGSRNFNETNQERNFEGGRRPYRSGNNRGGRDQQRKDYSRNQEANNTSNNSINSNSYASNNTGNNNNSSNNNNNNGSGNIINNNSNNTANNNNNNNNNNSNFTNNNGNNGTNNRMRRNDNNRGPRKPRISNNNNSNQNQSNPSAAGVAEKVTPPQLGPSNFPPLPSKSSDSRADATPTDSPAPIQANSTPLSPQTEVPHSHDSSSMAHKFSQVVQASNTPNISESTNNTVIVTAPVANTNAVPSPKEKAAAVSDDPSNGSDASHFNQIIDARESSNATPPGGRSWSAVVAKVESSPKISSSLQENKKP